MEESLYRSWMLMNARKFEQSEQQIRGYISQYPDDPQGYGTLAICLSDLERFTEAIEAAKYAIALSPDNAFLHHALGCIYLRSRKVELLDAAESSLLQAIELDPENADFYGSLAEACYYQGSFSKAKSGQKQEYWERGIAAARSGLELNAEQTNCLLYLIKSLLSLNPKQHIEEASVLCEQLLALAPEDAGSYEVYSWTLYYQADSKPNKQELERILGVINESLRLNPVQTNIKDAARWMVRDYYIRTDRIALWKVNRPAFFLLLASYSLLLLTLYSFNLFGWQNPWTIGGAIATCTSFLPLLEITLLEFKISRYPQTKHYLKVNPLIKSIWGIFGATLIVGFGWQVFPHFLKLLAALSIVLGAIALKTVRSKQQHLQREIKVNETQLASDPHNLDYLLNLASNLLLLDELKSFDRALEIYEEAISIDPLDHKVQQLRIELAIRKLGNKRPSKHDVERILETVEDCLHLEPNNRFSKDLAILLLYRHLNIFGLTSLITFDVLNLIGYSSALLIGMTIYAIVNKLPLYLAAIPAILTAIGLVHLLSTIYVYMRIWLSPQYRKFVSDDSFLERALGGSIQCLILVIFCIFSPAFVKHLVTPLLALGSFVFLVMLGSSPMHKYRHTLSGDRAV